MKKITLYVNISPAEVLARISASTDKTILEMKNKFRSKIKDWHFYLYKGTGYYFLEEYSLSYLFFWCPNLFWSNLYLDGKIEKVENGSKISLQSKFKLRYTFGNIVIYIFLPPMIIFLLYAGGLMNYILSVIFISGFLFTKIRLFSWYRADRENFIAFVVDLYQDTIIEKIVQ